MQIGGAVLHLDPCLPESEASSGGSESGARILVTIASYGQGNDPYLSQLVAEYQSMPFRTDLVVLSDRSKAVAPDVEVFVVDLRGKDPWSLPFPHKQIFADRLDRYDVFIYSEDDTLISRKNIEAFMHACKVLPENEIPGFFRFERGADGQINYPEVHGHFHWDCQSVRRRGEYTFAAFTNEHSACYALTRSQLRKAIASGGFLVGPHRGKYDLLCSAATDPYTQCGLQKVIGISNFDDFLVHHLPNKYIGSRFGVGESEIRRQLETLLQIGQKGHPPAPLFPVESKLTGAKYSKDCYQPVEPETISVIPNGVRSVLSLGCGSGATEAALAEKGVRVVAVPIDPVIASGVTTRGVEIVEGTFATARERLEKQEFDCLIISDVLHLVRDPSEVLSLFARLLHRKGRVIVRVPRTLRFGTFLLRKIRGGAAAEVLGSYDETGVHVTSQRVLRRWLKKAGLRIEDTINLPSHASAKIPRPFRRFLNPLFAEEMIVVATKA